MPRPASHKHKRSQLHSSEIEAAVQNMRDKLRPLLAFRAKLSSARTSEALAGLLKQVKFPTIAMRALDAHAELMNFVMMAEKNLQKPLDRDG